MALKLIGAVGVKVRPEADNFRDELERDLKRQLRDGHEMPVRMRPQVDSDRMRADFDRHAKMMRREMERLSAGMSVRAPSLDSGRFVRDSRRIASVHKRVYASMTRDVKNLSSERLKAEKSLRDVHADAARDWMGMREILASQLALMEAETAEVKARNRAENNSVAMTRQRLRMSERIRAELTRVRDQAERLDRANFTGVNRRLRQLAAQGQELTSVFGSVSKAVREVGQANVKRLHIDSNLFEQWEQAQRFRHEWNRIPDDDRKALSIDLQSRDNERIQDMLDRANDEARELRERLSNLSAPQLRRELDEARVAGHRFIDEFEREWNQRRWDSLGSPLIAQARDNARVREEYSRQFEHIRDEADRTQKHIDGLEAKMHVGLTGEAGVAAHMAWLTRPRTAPIHAIVSAKSIAVAEGILQSLTGTNTMRRFGTALENIVTNFDMFSLKGAGVVTLLGNLSNAVVGAVASIFSVGEGLVNLVGGAAMLPTVLGAVGTTAVIARTALGDFFSALRSGETEGLVENAAKNVDALRGTWTELSDVIQTRFWERAGTSFSDFILKTMPTLSRGLGEASEALGGVWDNLFGALGSSFEQGHFDTMFDGLTGGLEGAARATRPFVNALMTLGARGATHLPRLGEWLNSSAEAFENWIVQADRAGDIDRWINEAATAFRDVGTFGRGAVDVMTGFTRAALAAGGPTLTDLAEGTVRFGDALNSLRGQQIMTTVFTGALEGLSRLGDGLGNFFNTVGEHIDYVHDLEVAVGDLGGSVFNSLSLILDNPNFRSGTLSGLQDINTAVERLAPAFSDAGSIIGSFADLSGDVLKGIAPTINQVFETVSDFVDKVEEPISDLIPKLTAGMGGLIGAIDAPVQAAGSMIGGLIDGFNAMPSAIQTAILTLGGLVALRPHLSAMGNALGNNLLPAYTTWGQRARELQTTLGEQGRSITMTTAGYRVFKQEMVAAAGSAESFRRIIGRQLDDVNERMQVLNATVGPQDRSFKQLAATQKQLTAQMREAEFASTRFGSAFAAMDRLTGQVDTNFTGIGMGLQSMRDGFRTATVDASSNMRALVSTVRESSSDIARFVMDPLGGATGPDAKNSNQAARMRQSYTQAFDAIKTASANMATGFPSSVRTFTSGFGQIVTGAGQAAKAIGTTAASGLRSAASGLMGAMGGPWGLALAGAAVGFSVYAAESAKAKQRTQEYASTLNQSTGQVTLATRQWAAQQAAMERTSLGFIDLGRTAYDAGADVGLSADTITRAFEGNQTAIDSARQAIDEWQAANRNSLNFNKNSAISQLEGELASAEERAAAARAQIEQIAGALGTTSAQAANLNSTWTGFTDQVSKAQVTGAGLLGTLDQLSGSTMAAADAAYNYESAWASTRTNLSGWVSSFDGDLKSLSGSMVNHFTEFGSAFDMTKQSSRELYGILRQQVEPAFESVAQAFNNAGGGEAGMQAARDAMQNVRDSMYENLTQVQGFTDEAATAMLDSLNIKPDAIEVLLEDAEAQATLQSIDDSLALLSGRKTKAQIELEGAQEAETLAESARQKLEALGNTDARAKLSAEDQNLTEVVNGSMNDLQQIAAQQWIAQIAAVDGASGIVAGVRSALEAGFDNQSYEAVLTALDNTSGIAESAKDKIMGAFVQGDYEAVLTAIDEASGISGEAKAALESVVGEYSSTLTSDDQASTNIETVKNGLGEIDGSTAEATVNVTLPGDSNGDGALSWWERFKGQFTGDTVSVEVEATVTGEAQVQSLATSLEGLQDKPVHVSVTNSGAESIERMQGRINALQDKTVHVTVTNSGAESLDRMNARIAALQPKSVHVTVTNSGAESLDRMQARINGIQSKSAHVTVTNSGADSLVRLKGRIDAIKSKAQHVTVTNSGSESLERLKARIDAIRSKSEHVTVTNSGSDSLVRLKGRIDAIRSKSVHVSVTNSGSDSLLRLQSRINAVRGKTVTVRVNTVGMSALANGGIMNSAGMQAFANGGFYNGGMAPDPRMRFLTENHTAQIAPAGSYRVWAEQETGGEAYIPLAEAKRSRSEAILSEVARRFGGRYEKFADGGITTSGGGAVTNNVTLNNVPMDVAGETAEEVMFHLRHMKHGGGALAGAH